MPDAHVLPGDPAARPAPEAPPAGDLERDMDVLFEEWREQEAHVDLSDLSWQDILAFAIFWALFAVVALQFWTRYVLNNSVGWTEEIARYLLILVTFVGSVTAMRKGSHIAVEVMLVYLPAAGPSTGRWWASTGWWPCFAAR